MTDRQKQPQAPGDEPADEASRPAEAAALHKDGGEGEDTPQDATEDTRWDTDQHSDAPGPTGTG